MLTAIGRWLPFEIIRRILFKSSRNDYDAMLTFYSQYMDDESGDWVIREREKIPVKVQQIDDGCWICYSAIKELETKKAKIQTEMSYIDNNIEFLKKQSEIPEKKL